MSPATWISIEACPIIVMRIPSTRTSGLTGVTGTERGHFATPRASFHRSTSFRPRSVGACPGLKNRKPSKWSDGGPW
ncbi:hypothetical protein QP150_17710 [Sphingomonas sp. 22L2VL55-3]